MNDVEDNGQPPEQPIKVTILLPLDTVNKIDQMAKIAGFGSRGRTIQALVDTLSTSQIDILNILNLLNEVSRRGTELSKQEQGGYGTGIILSINNLVIRLNQFLGLKPERATQEKGSRRK